MSAACASAAFDSALFIFNGPQPALARSWLVSASTWDSVAPEPPLPVGLEVVRVGAGVAVWLGFGDDLAGLLDGFGVRVASRLGAVVFRVGAGGGVGVVARVRDGVALGGVDDGVVGRTVVRDASSASGTPSAGVLAVIGRSWLVTFRLSMSCRTNHPMPTSRTSADKEAINGPATPAPGDR